MSTSSSIDIKIINQNNQTISPIKMIQSLLNFGWTLNDNGKITYLPLGDNNMFDWINENISPEKLLKILEKKEEANEIIGIYMTWENTNIGGSFLFWNDNKISLSLSINRKTLIYNDNLKITDVNWYLTKILPIFNQNNLQIESFSYEEHV